MLTGLPQDADSLARLFILSRSDRHLVAERLSDASRLGVAVQLALLRHPGTVLANLDQSPEPLVIWLATQLGIPAAAFAAYARRPQTMTDHARRLAMTLGLRAPVAADLVPMIEVAAQAAWASNRGQPIVAAVITALRTAGIILPPAAVIERAAIAGRARARKPATDALLGGMTEEQLAKLDRLLVSDGSVGPVAGSRRCRLHPRRITSANCSIGWAAFGKSVCSPTYPSALWRSGSDNSCVKDMPRTPINSAATRHTGGGRFLIAPAADLESCLTDAVLDMADKLIGGVFAKARNAVRQRYVASGADMGRLMLLFHGTIEALVAAQESDTDAFEGDRHCSFTALWSRTISSANVRDGRVWLLQGKCGESVARYSDVVSWRFARSVSAAGALGSASGASPCALARSSRIRDHMSRPSMQW